MHHHAKQTNKAGLILITNRNLIHLQLGNRMGKQETDRNLGKGQRAGSDAF
jgi:hypothetical protein